MKKKFRTRILVLRDGKLEVDAPVRRGDEVEVSVEVIERDPPTFPLRGLPVRYDQPFDPAVPADEWEAEG